jgi:hypothetical protein
MRAIVSTLIATVACLVYLSALAAQPPGAAAPQIPQLSREQALAYLEQRRLAPAPGNLVSPILHGDAEAVEALLAAGVDVNDTSELPKPALRLAASASGCPDALGERPRLRPRVVPEEAEDRGQEAQLRFRPATLGM